MENRWYPVADRDGRRGLLKSCTSDVSQLEVRLDTGEKLFIPRARVIDGPDGSYVFDDSFTGLLEWSSSEAVLPIVREYVQITKRVVERERVRVTKSPAAQAEIVDVPLVQQDVTVERVPVGRVVEAAAPPRQEGDTLVVPVYEEVLVVEKRLVLKEEIRLTRAHRERRERHEVELRRDEVHVEHTRAPKAAATGGEGFDSINWHPQSDNIEGNTIMAKTLIGVFDDKSSAQNAIRDLEAAGIQRSQVHLMENSEATSNTSTDDLPWTERISNWFDSLFDDDDDRAHGHHYAEAWRRGHYVLTVDVESALVDRAADIMNRAGAIDIERRAQEWQKTGYNGTYDRTAKPYTAEQRTRELATYQRQQQQTAGTQAIPVVQEELAVGKRVVQRGGVRVHSYVQERPVEEVVRLREERVRVQRVPVNRPATEADLAFKERVVDVRAMGEEAVVEKRARVVEEVVVGKEVEQRDQTIKETVRRKDVQVEQLPTSTKTATNNTTTSTTRASQPGPRPSQPESRR